MRIEDYLATPHPSKIVFQKFGIPLSAVSNYIGRSYAHTSGMLRGLHRITPEVSRKLNELVAIVEAAAGESCPEGRRPDATD